MIKEIVNQQSKDVLGGFTATYADPILAHVNPNQLHKNDIVIVVKSDQSVWAKRVSQEDGWQEITRDNLKKKKSPIMQKTCFFEIKKGELSGTYIISEDIIANEHFSNEKAYLEFLAE